MRIFEDTRLRLRPIPTSPNVNYNNYFMIIVITVTIIYNEIFIFKWAPQGGGPEWWGALTWKM